MTQTTEQTLVYKARREPRQVLLGAAFMGFGIGFYYFAEMMRQYTISARRRGGAGAALLCILIGLYMILQVALRFPRIEISAGGIVSRGLFTRERASWDALGAFEVETRPFNMNFGNDIVSAPKSGGGRFSLWLRPFDVNAHALMMELNKRRAADGAQATAGNARG